MKDEEKKENPVEDAGESKPEEKKPEEPTGAEQAEKTPPETPPVGEKPADSPPDASQGEENGEGAKQENPDAPPEVTEEKPDTQPGEEAPAEPAAESTNDELLLARAELSAIKSGMSVSVAEDAVVLAMHDLKKDGAVPDQAGLEKALKGVLKRHPEWDAKKQQGTPAGFKVGADGSQNQNSAADDTISRAFGNK